MRCHTGHRPQRKSRTSHDNHRCKAWSPVQLHNFLSIKKEQKVLDDLNKINKLQATSALAGFHCGGVYPGWNKTWRCWFLWREVNWRTRKKTLRARREPARTTHIWDAPDGITVRSVWYGFRLCHNTKTKVITCTLSEPFTDYTEYPVNQ